jgi:preprotein translocase subunit Sec61beta
LNELTSAIIVQYFVELAGKAIKIDCVAIYCDRFFEQAPR